MATISWKPVYETGIVALDNEHRRLIEAVNQLFEAIRDKRSDEVLDEVLAMLEDYTIHHFQHEEKLMEEYNFLGLPKHKKLHQELIASLEKIKAEPVDKVKMATNLLTFLRSWVLNHIVEVDKKYGSYLESRGGKFIS